MASRSYRIGQRFEYRIRDHLRKLGWLVVRSPRSAGPFDLIAIGSGSVLLVQCKVDGVMPPAEWNTLFNLAERYDVVPIVVFRVGRVLQWRRLIAPKIILHKPQPWAKVSICHATHPERTVQAA